MAIAAALACWVWFQSPTGAAQPDAAQRQYQQALTLFRDGQYDRAAEVLKKTIALQPQSAEAHHLLGLALFSREKRSR